MLHYTDLIKYSRLIGIFIWALFVCFSSEFLTSMFTLLFLEEVVSTLLTIQIILLSWKTSSDSWIIKRCLQQNLCQDLASSPRWPLKEFLQVYHSVKLVALTIFWVSTQSKGNSQSFTCYQSTTTCTYINSSCIEFVLVV